ncbi:MAG: PorP/SprF family type IX secretion system membrane protein [Prevotellaceae bacterium]|jgi:type IX secretion system PorP/SprF family membrane protein|nr:PorP/SprF family type IX secretion system membrane protein [Prevotellaceae bacterium]
MKKIITIIIVSVFIGNAVTVAAQPHFGEQGNLHYRDYELLLNPAVAGVAMQTQLTLGVYKQWTGIEGAPLSEFLSFQTPLVQNNGLGAWVHNNSYGVTDHLQAGAAYAYQIRLKNNYLSFGLSLSALMLYESRVMDLNDANDPVFAKPLDSQFGFNAGFGLYYSGDKFYAGLSIPQLLTNEIKDNHLGNNFDFARLQYYFIGGYRFDLTNRVSLSPAALLQLSGTTRPGYEFMFTAAYDRKVELGAGWASPAQLQVSAGVAITKQLLLRYQFSQGAGSDYRAGSSHFIVVRLAWGERKVAPSVATDTN